MEWTYNYSMSIGGAMPQHQHKPRLKNIAVIVWMMFCIQSLMKCCAVESMRPRSDSGDCKKVGLLKMVMDVLNVSYVKLSSSE